MADYYNEKNQLNLNKIWQDALFGIAKKVSSTSYEVWIKNLDVVELDENTLVLAAPTTTAKKLLDNNYKTIIVDELNKLHRAIIDVEFVISSEYVPESVQKQTEQQFAESPKEETEKVVSSVFNPQYTFDNFVVGPSNQFVASAAKSVAENPGKTFNPLFIYGGVGLGKTHLLHAIGNYLTENNPKLKVVYKRTPDFSNELSDAIRQSKSGGTSQFREKYRKVDVLILDDIQEIIKRDAAQVEFFNTFNDMHESGKQIVVASDRPITELKQLEERLRTRLGWGLIADIGVPDFETRVAILNKKVYLGRHNVAKEVVNFIAENVTTNVREMEEMLTRVVFYAKIHGQNVVTLDIAREALKDMPIEGENLDVGRVIECVCKFYGLKKEELLSKKRTNEIAQPRQIAMYLITELINMPQESVGRVFNKDHSTVIYAKTKVAKDMKTDKKLARDINDMMQMLKGK